MSDSTLAADCSGVAPLDQLEAVVAAVWTGQCAASAPAARRLYQGSRAVAAASHQSFASQTPAWMRMRPAGHRVCVENWSASRHFGSAEERSSQLAVGSLANPLVPSMSVYWGLGTGQQTVRSSLRVLVARGRTGAGCPLPLALRCVSSYLSGGDILVVEKLVAGAETD